MSRTERTAYDGHPIRDGDWGKRCPEKNCPACHTGAEKSAAARKERYDKALKEVEAAELDLARAILEATERNEP